MKPYCGLLDDFSGDAITEPGKVGFCGPHCKHCGPEPDVAIQYGIFVCAADFEYEED